MDTVSQEIRSAIMRKIRGKDTTPEIVVRKMLHSAGYRYRLHRKDLPGSPDLVFPSRKKVVFVNGCFWHHHGCKISKIPKTRTDYWKEKFRKNKERDKNNYKSLKEIGWSVLIVWECETKKFDYLQKKLMKYLQK